MTSFDLARPFRRYVALGDSQTLGEGDRAPDGTWRGWADRLAERLAATTSPGLEYANLAVSGVRTAHVRRVQLPAALELAPDLATVAVGMNDLLRHDYDLDGVRRDLDATLAALVDGGAVVATMTFPDVARMLPVMRWLRPREERLVETVREVADRHGAAVLDLFAEPMVADSTLWSHDRIHGSSEGHRRIAEGMASLFGLPGSDPAWASIELAPRAWPRTVAREAHWVATFLLPFLHRQARRRGAAETEQGKRPRPTSVH